MEKTYNPASFEDRLYRDWEERGCFKAVRDDDKIPFTVMMPPPNITGQLHMGHAMDETMQDKIKGLGRKVKNFDENIWNEVKYHIVLTGNYYKFSQNKQLRQVLLSTGESILVEASPLDMIWGIGIDANNENAYHPEKWNGSNLLGFALTEVREEIKRIRKYENEILNLQDEDT